MLLACDARCHNNALCSYVLYGYVAFTNFYDYSARRTICWNNVDSLFLLYKTLIRKARLDTNIVFLIRECDTAFSVEVKVEEREEASAPFWQQ